MASQYETMRNELQTQLNEVASNQKIMDALNTKLSNTGTEPDYDAWLSGSAKFAKDNEEILKAMVKRGWI